MYSGKAVLSLLAHWPDAVHFSLEDVGGASSLFQFLKLFASEYLTGADEFFSTTLIRQQTVSDNANEEKTMDGDTDHSFAISGEGSDPTNAHLAAIEIVSSKIVEALKEEVEKNKQVSVKQEKRDGKQQHAQHDMLAGVLLQYCIENSFWLSSTQHPQHNMPDFNLACWIISLGTYASSLWDSNCQSLISFQI